MKSVTLLTFGLALVAAWSQDCARGQNSVAPPLSLVPSSREKPAAPPPPRAGANNSGPRGAAPLTNGSPPPPNPAVDYDGFSASTVEDNDGRDQMAKPARSRAARSSKPAPETSGSTTQQLIDQEDEALKRKLTICQGCK
ncbi:hypothetical protein JQ543_13290 [Bradyrhizobium diazoefficiens]|nr:hypothetical protein [Bradyrhizobium diazoefficiens]MBR0848722.1 hypothetical protein [Bradyrhizobium diazoefficiens]